MNGNNIWVIIVLIVVIVGGWFLLSGKPAEAPSPSVSNQVPIVGSTTPETTVENATPDVTVTYNNDGFSPKSVTVPAGTKVTFVNQSSGNMWVASAKHPDHTVYSGTSLNQHCPDTSGTAFDQCGTGTSYSFTFNKIGTWNYHNHRSAADFGTIIVIGIASSTQI